MADGITVWHVLEAFAVRAERCQTEYSTKGEIAIELDRPRSETDPVVDQAIEAGSLDEDPRYRGYWRLTEHGQGVLDAPTFMPSE